MVQSGAISAWHAERLGTAFGPAGKKQAARIAVGEPGAGLKLVASASDTGVMFGGLRHPPRTACFTAQTRILTARGLIRAARLRVGDLVQTRDNGFQAIRWIGQRGLARADLLGAPHLRPILIRAGALAPGRPQRDMLVSPHHRVLLHGAGGLGLLPPDADEALASAEALLGCPGIRAVLPRRGVTYVHFLCDRHELVVSDGAWTESFLPCPGGVSAFDRAQIAEFLTLFPTLGEVGTDAALFAPARVLLDPSKLAFGQVS